MVILKWKIELVAYTPLLGVKHMSLYTFTDPSNELLNSAEILVYLNELIKKISSEFRIRLESKTRHLGFSLPFFLIF